MNAYKPTPEEESAQRRADNDREGQKDCAAALVACELARSKAAGPAGSLGVVGGSLPVSSAQFFYGWLRARADRFHVIGMNAKALYSAAEDFRRDMGLPIPRQPEENVHDEP